MTYRMEINDKLLISDSISGVVADKLIASDEIVKSIILELSKRFSFTELNNKILYLDSQITVLTVMPLHELFVNSVIEIDRDKVEFSYSNIFMLYDFMDYDESVLRNLPNYSENEMSNNERYPYKNFNDYNIVIIRDISLIPKYILKYILMHLPKHVSVYLIGDMFVDCIDHNYYQNNISNISKYMFKVEEPTKYKYNIGKKLFRLLQNSKKKINRDEIKSSGDIIKIFDSDIINIDDINNLLNDDEVIGIPKKFYKKLNTIIFKSRNGLDTAELVNGETVLYLDQPLTVIYNSILITFPANSKFKVYKTYEDNKFYKSITVGNDGSLKQLVDLIYIGDDADEYSYIYETNQYKILEKVNIDLGHYYNNFILDDVLDNEDIKRSVITSSLNIDHDAPHTLNNIKFSPYRIATSDKIKYLEIDKLSLFIEWYKVVNLFDETRPLYNYLCSSIDKVTLYNFDKIILEDY